MRTSFNKLSHLKALLKKNWLIWKFNKSSAFCELFIPVLCVLVMALLYSNGNGNENLPDTSYLNDPNYIYHFDDTLNATHQNVLRACPISRSSAMIGLAPEGDSLIKELQRIFETNVGLKTRLFRDIDDINAFTSSPEYRLSPGLALCSAIVISKNNVEDKYEYTLLFNITRSLDVKIRETRMDLGSSAEYAKMGVMAIQNMIDNLILRNSTGNSNSAIQAAVAPKITKDWETKRPPLCMELATLMLLILPLLVPFRRFFNRMKSEKGILTESSMKRKGPSKTTCYLSWAIIYLIVFTTISLFSALILCYSSFPLSGFWYVFLWHWEFTLWLIVLGIFLFIIWKQSPSSAIWVMKFYLSLCGIQILDYCSEGRTELKLILESFHPPISLGISGNYLLMLEMAQLGLNSETISLQIFHYKMIYYYIMTFVDIIIYIILCICLENVKQLFNYTRLFSICIRKKKSFVRSEVDESRENKKLLFELVSPENFQDVEPRLRSQSPAEESVKVQNLSKKDSSGETIVNDVSFTIHQNQIFALLGPQDEGKAAIISMLKGDESPTEGTIEIFGMVASNQVNRPKIRNMTNLYFMLSYYFQSTYYWELTVKENLEFYASIKGVHAEDLAQEVETIMKDFELFNKKDELPNKLIADELRILSLCIDFIGSKFVILETLCSDMSLAEQRKLWDIIKKYKNDRVILLNTESSDEAYYLADMVATTAEGRILEIGEPLSLQAKFRGYRLIVMKQGFNTPSQPIIDVIFDHVREAKVLLDISYKVIFQLPEETSSEFQTLFYNLDMRKAELNICSYEICSNSMGNVYLSAESPQSDSNSVIDNSPINFGDEELEDFDLKEQRIRDGWQLFWTQLKAIALKKINLVRRDETNQFFGFYFPLVLVIIGTLVSKLEINPLSPALPLYDDFYDKKFTVNYNTMLPNREGLALDSDFLSKFNSNFFQLTPKMIQDIVEFDQALSVTKLDIVSSNISVFSFYMDTFNKTTDVYKYTAFINTRAPEGGPFALNKINNAILRSATGNNRKEITVTISSFQRTLHEKRNDFSFGHLYFQFMVISGISWFFLAVLGSILSKGELLIRSRQTLAGVSATTYWVANYFVDMLRYLIWVVLSCLIMTIFGVTCVTEEYKLGALWAIFISFGFSSMSFTYLISCWIKHNGRRTNQYMLLASYLNLILIASGIEPFVSILRWVSRIIPFTMSYSLRTLFDLEVISAVKKYQVDVFNIDLILGDVIAWISGAVIYFGLLLLVEYNECKLHKRYKTRWFLFIIDRESSQRHAVSVDNFDVVAVDRRSFDIKEGECFAIVGPEKAGKTVICKILAGDTIPTDGNIFMNGFSIPGQLSKVKWDIGFLSQENSLLLDLTVKEHLDFYAAIKGIPDRVRERLIAKHLHEMQLDNFKHVLIRNLNAKNQLNLSLAIALIGNPSILILDNPYGRAEPKERVAIYNAISQAFKRKKQPTLIFTAQSLLEAETLATKIGVMTEGIFRSISTIQQIRDEFHRAEFDITVEMVEINQGQVESAIQRSGSVSKQKINRQRVDQILDQLELSDLKKEIAYIGSGASIHQNLMENNNTGSVSINSVIEWALTIQNGRKVKEFLRDNFGEITMWGPIPSYSSFILQLKNGPSIAKIFELLNSNKAFLDIREYLIQQVPLEKLFHRSMRPAPQKFWDFIQSEIEFRIRYDPSTVRKASPL